MEYRNPKHHRIYEIAQAYKRHMRDMLRQGRWVWDGTTYPDRASFLKAARKLIRETEALLPSTKT
jgi:hypothetical protein